MASNLYVRWNLWNISIQTVTCSVLATYHLYEFSHSALGYTASAKDIDSLVGNLVCGACGVGLEQADGAAEVLGLLCVGHVRHLIRDGLEPGLVGFDVRDHLCKSVEVVSWRCRVGMTARGGGWMQGLRQAHVDFLV